MVQLFDHVYRFAAPGHHLIDIFEQFVAFCNGQRFVHAARNRTCAVDTFSRRVTDHFLAEFAQQDAAFGGFRIFFRDADDIAFGDVAVETEQQIGRAKVEKMQRMRLQYLTVVHQSAHLLGGGR